MPEEAQVVAPETPPAEPVVPESLDVRMAKTIETKLAELTPAESETVPATEPAEATPAAVTTPEPTIETPAVPVDVPFSPEEIANPKHWDGLDKAGWERAARLHPVETARVKAAYSAASRIAAAAQQAPVPAPPAVTQPPAKPAISPEMKAALDRANSLDVEEARTGQLEVARLTIREEMAREREVGQQASKQAKSELDRAYAGALTTEPQIANISDADLDAAVLASPRLLQMLDVAKTVPDEAQRIFMTEYVMVEAARSHIAKAATAKITAEAAAAEKKKAESQARLRSNENNASTLVVTTQPGKTTPAKKPIEQFIAEKLAQAG